MMEWISVTDRLPKKTMWCIVFGSLRFQVAEYHENEFWWPCFGYSNSNMHGITHWMPLPKPPHHIGGADKKVNE